jgi:hypothetical protein
VKEPARLTYQIGSKCLIISDSAQVVTLTDVLAGKDLEGMGRVRSSASRERAFGRPGSWPGSYALPNRAALKRSFWTLSTRRSVPMDARDLASQYCVSYDLLWKDRNESDV